MRVLRSAWVRQSGTGRCFQSSTGQFVGWFVWGYLGATGKEQVACFLHTFKEQLSTVRTCSVSIWYLVPVLGALCLLRLSHTRVHAGAGNMHWCWQQDYFKLELTTRTRA